MKELDIETKIALVKMAYDGDGRLVKFTDKIYGFYNDNNTVNFIRLTDLTIIKQEYTIQYIIDKVMVVFASNQNDLSDIRSYILDISHKQGSDSTTVDSKFSNQFEKCLKVII